MSIVDGRGLITWEGGLFEPGSDLLRRTQWAFARIRADGGRIILNEAGRPFGVPGDASVRSASLTASGVSTVWFQWGRYLRGETPSAADPRSGNTLASEHTQGIATDTNAPSVFDMTLRAKYFTQVGMRNTIASESWHWAIRSAPQVDLASISGVGNVTHLTTAAVAAKPILEDIMAVRAINAKNGNAYLVGQEFIHQLPDANYSAGTAQYGDAVTLSEAQFHALCDSNGIPWNVVPAIGPGAGWSMLRVVNGNMMTGIFKESW